MYCKCCVLVLEQSEKLNHVSRLIGNSLQSLEHRVRPETIFLLSYLYNDSSYYLLVAAEHEKLRRRICHI